MSTAIIATKRFDKHSTIRKLKAANYYEVSKEDKKLISTTKSSNENLKNQGKSI